MDRKMYVWWASFLRRIDNRLLHVIINGIDVIIIDKLTILLQIVHK